MKTKILFIGMVLLVGSANVSRAQDIASSLQGCSRYLTMCTTK